MKPAQQRVRVGFLVKAFGVSVRRACQVIQFNRATQYYRSKRNPFNEVLLARIKSIAAVRVRCGDRRIHVFLRREGFQVNHQRVYRLYAAEGLNLRAKVPRRRRAPRSFARHGGHQRVPTRCGQWTSSMTARRIIARSDS